MAKSKKEPKEPVEEHIEEPAEGEVVDNIAEETPEADPVAELQAAVAAEKEKYLRLAAEYDNYRKRSLKERESIYSDVRGDTITKLLPVYDNLARALKQTCTDEAFYKGVEMTMTQLREILGTMGVKEIEAVGQPFDPAKHNAILQLENPEFEADVIIDEVKTGFTLGDKVIRHSDVIVAK
ncbi:MAG: nucleotide exchange factor GrpE [Oscillospiraceae bacterium]|nr:nucleotide exchange factor GrpE [Oscillospiraceae bacterium]